MIFVGRGYGLVAADVEVWLGPFMADHYRRILGNPAVLDAATKAFQRYAVIRGLYASADIDGDWGRLTERAWNALLPGASGVTTTRALERLRDLAPDRFLTQIQLGIAAARDNYLRRLGRIQTSPDPTAERRTSVPGGPGDTVAQSEASAQYLSDQGEAMIAELTSSVDTEQPVGQATEIQGPRPVVTEPPAVEEPRKMSTAAKAGIGIAMAVIVVGLAIGLAAAGRKPRRLTAKARAAKARLKKKRGR
jgi:hypothetical protein